MSEAWSLVLRVRENTKLSKPSFRGAFRKSTSTLRKEATPASSQDVVAGMTWARRPRAIKKLFSPSFVRLAVVAVLEELVCSSVLTRSPRSVNQISLVALSSLSAHSAAVPSFFLLTFFHGRKLPFSGIG